MALLLIVSGWAICLAALALFGGLRERFFFVLAGVAVQMLGLALLARSYRAEQLHPPLRGGSR